MSPWSWIWSHAARAEVFDDIERFCTPRRRHSKVGGLSPMAFEERTAQT